MSIYHKLSPFFLAAMTAACVTTQVSPVGPSRPIRTAATAIGVVNSGGTLPEYDIVGTLMATHSVYRNAEASIDALKEEASKLGADAILDVSWGGPQKRFVVAPDSSGTSTFGFASTNGSAVIATAIRWRSTNDLEKRKPEEQDTQPRGVPRSRG